jgi:hypothetical protein
MVSFTYTSFTLLVGVAAFQGISASQVGTIIKDVFKDVTGLKVRGETNLWERGEYLSFIALLQKF